MQSVPITTKVVSSNPHRQAVHDATLCDKVNQWLATGRLFSPGTPVSSTNKADRHHITVILLKVALNTINLTINIGNPTIILEKKRKITLTHITKNKNILHVI